MSLKILLTNNTLHHRAGSELYIRDIAIELTNRGHNVMAFSTQLGEVATELRNTAGISVIDDLNNLADVPDIIHGHHHFDTMAALLHFPNTPAISYCHGWLPIEEAPIKFPTIVNYIAISKVCYKRLVCEGGIDPKMVQILHNFVRISMFEKRAPLPEKPTHALIFSNCAHENSLHVKIIKQACAHLGIKLDIIGESNGNSIANPEKILVDYDLVFAKGRAAIEAMAVGNAVILADSIGLGQLVTAKNFFYFRDYNFAFQVMRNQFTLQNVIEEIKKYEKNDVSIVNTLVRENNDINLAVTKLESIYNDSIIKFNKIYKKNKSLKKMRSASIYILWLKKQAKENNQASTNLHVLTQHYKELEKVLLYCQKRKSFWKGYFIIMLLGYMVSFLVLLPYLVFVFR